MDRHVTWVAATVTTIVASFGAVYFGFHVAAFGLFLLACTPIPARLAALAVALGLKHSRGEGAVRRRGTG